VLVATTVLPEIPTPPRRPRRHPPVHTHSFIGAGSDASPSEFTYVRAATAAITPTAALTGTHTSRQRRVRQPIATTRTTIERISTVIGNQPPSSEVPWPHLLKSGSGNRGISVGVGTCGEGGVGPFGGTPSV
jgi:hypothetical protein